jgi:hypothetical protein
MDAHRRRQWPTRSGKGFTQTVDFLPGIPGGIVILPNELKFKREGALPPSSSLPRCCFSSLFPRVFSFS